MSQQEPPEVEAAKKAWREAWPGQKGLMREKLKWARTEALRREIEARDGKHDS